MSDKAIIWFFTDIHGSNTCFKKILKQVENKNRPNTIIIGADITGKQIIPLIESDNDTFIIPLSGNEVKKREEERESIKKELGAVGYYPYECTEHEYKQLISSDLKQEEIFEKLAAARLEEWVKMADEKLYGIEHCKIIINAGNDDPFFVDQVLDKSKYLIHAEGKIIDLPGKIKLLSTGYSNGTPWDCPRDISEKELSKKIALMTDSITTAARFIFNFHCPPINTSLDLANNLDEKTLRKTHGRKHVGSSATRTAIEHWQPIASFHGHIHEVHTKEYLGQTLCFNPGTDYTNGKLQGAFVKISDGMIEYETLTREMLNEKGTDTSEGVFKTVLKNLPLVGSYIKDHLSTVKQNEIAKDIQEVKESIAEIKNGFKK